MVCPRKTRNNTEIGIHGASALDLSLVLSAAEGDEAEGGEAGEEGVGAGFADVAAARIRDEIPQILTGPLGAARGLRPFFSHERSGLPDGFAGDIGAEAAGNTQGIVDRDDFTGPNLSLANPEGGLSDGGNRYRGIPYGGFAHFERNGGHRRGALVGLDGEAGNHDRVVVQGPGGIGKVDVAGGLDPTVDDVGGTLLAAIGGAELEIGHIGQRDVATGFAVVENQHEVGHLAAGEGAAGGLPAHGLSCGDRAEQSENEDGTK